MKKRISFLCALVMVVCVLMTQVISASAADASTITVSNASAVAGETVSVTVDLAGNPGIVSANLYVNYDAEVLTLKEVKDAALLPGAMHSDNFVTSPYGLSWVNDVATENYTENGTLATLVFEIAADAEAGTTTTISLEQDILNCDMDSVDFELVSGEVQVADAAPAPTTTAPATTVAPTTAAPADDTATTAPATTAAPADDTATTAPATTVAPTTGVNATSATGGSSTVDTPSASNSNSGAVQTGNASMAFVVLLVLVSASAGLYFARKRVK